MQVLARFLKPNRSRVLLCIAFALIAAGGMIETWAFSDIPPKPLLYDVLEPLPLWLLWVYLAAPLFTVLAVLKLGNMPSPLFELANAVYFYLLSCLLAVSFVYGKQRFPKWLPAVIAGGPPVFLLGMLLISGETIRETFSAMMIVYYVIPTSLVGSLCLYVLCCLGLLVHDVIKINTTAP